MWSSIPVLNELMRSFFQPIHPTHEPKLRTFNLFAKETPHAELSLESMVGLRRARAFDVRDELGELAAIRYEDSDDETILSADMPGMTDDDIDVTVQGHYVTIRGERKPKGGRYLRRARFHGAFERSFFVGEQYDLDHVDAHLVNGELTIRLRKAAKAKPRRIKLTSGIAAKVRGLLGVEKEKPQQEQPAA